VSPGKGFSSSLLRRKKEKEVQSHRREKIVTISTVKKKRGKGLTTWIVKLRENRGGSRGGLLLA